MGFENIRYEVADRIATITFDRPDRYDAKEGPQAFLDKRDPEWRCQ